MKSMAIVLLSILAGSSMCWAQGTITDGAATFTWNAFNVNVNNADYTVGGGPDHLFEDWWYFRMDGDPDETAFPAPNSQSYVGSVATLSWTNVAGRGFNARLRTEVFEGGHGTSSYVKHALTIINPGPTSFVISIFGYLDLDRSNTSNDDRAILLADPELMLVFDATAVGEYKGMGAFEFQVSDTQGGPASLRMLMSDGLPTNLDGSGLPFSPGNWEGAYQWGDDLAPGKATFTKLYSIGQEIPDEIFSDNFECGNTSAWC